MSRSTARAEGLWADTRHTARTPSNAQPLAVAEGPTLVEAGSTSCPHRAAGVPPEWTLSGSVVAAEAKDRLEPDWARLRFSAARDRDALVRRGSSRQVCAAAIKGAAPSARQCPPSSEAQCTGPGKRLPVTPLPPGGPWRRGWACLRGEEHLVPASPRGSSRWTDFGRGFLGFAFGWPRPCSSRICCCFLRRYSCLMSSRRAFSSSFRIRSSSALRLTNRPDSPG